MAADVERVRGVFLAALSVLERGLDAIADARHRAATRRFLKDHPDVTVYYPDGERGH